MSPLGKGTIIPLVASKHLQHGVGGAGRLFEPVLAADLYRPTLSDWLPPNPPTSQT